MKKRLNLVAKRSNRSFLPPKKAKSYHIQASKHLFQKEHRPMSGFIFRGRPKKMEKELKKPQKVLHQTASSPNHCNSPQTSITLSHHPPLWLLYPSQLPRQKTQQPEELTNLQALKLTWGFHLHLIWQ